MNLRWQRILFVVAGVYDAFLGLAFLLFPARVFDSYGVTPPNHYGYVQFSALLLIIFGVMFFRIAGDPAGRRELIPYGCALKAAYCGIAFWYDFTSGIPAMWKPFAWADLVFLVLFLWAWFAPPRVTATS